MTRQRLTISVLDEGGDDRMAGCGQTEAKQQWYEYSEANRDMIVVEDGG